MCTIRRRGLISGLAGGIFFGTAAIFIRLLTINSLSIVCYRLILGGLILLLITKIPKQLSYISTSFYLGTILFLHFYFFVDSVQNTYILNATLIVNSTPMITLLLLFIFRLEKINKKDLFLVLIGFSGILLMTWHNLSLGNYLIGDIEALIAAFFISLYGILGRMKVAGEYNPYNLAGLIYIFAGIEATSLTVGLGALEFPVGTNEIIYIFLLALIPTAIGHTLYLRSLKDLKPYETQILALLEPIVATIIGIFIFREFPPLLSIIGSGLVCLSIIVISHKYFKLK
ncbi:MAG: DMT family transporter [Candidatus Njordarchaeales archaeon]